MPGTHTTRAAEVIARCQKLASFSEDSGSTRRTFLSPPMRDCHRELAGWLTAAGAATTIDAAGNLRSIYPAAQPDAPRLLLGSHLDTVPNAGAYDGILGVVLAVALIESLEAQKLPFAIEVVGFSEEEGVRFGTPFIGSRALVGRCGDDLLNLRDAEGISVHDAIEHFGLDPGQLSDAVVKDDAFAYIEFHIEQGPVLESFDRPLGVVEAIAGQTRAEFLFLGRANHAGTTPMDLRCDALAAAAEWIVAVERIGRTDPGLMATVGRIEAKPGAVNVIASEARVSLDLRHKSDAIRERAASVLLREAEEIAERRGVSLQHRELLRQPAVAMDPFLIEQIAEAIQQTGCDPHRMVSGAGHDAMILAEKVSSAMIFLRTPGGISHEPAETVLIGDVARSLECGSHLLRGLAASQTFFNNKKRTSLA